MRRTGWVYAKANRVPRAVQEVLAAFERIRPRLKLTPSGGRPRKAGAGRGRRTARRRRRLGGQTAAADARHPPDASFGYPVSMSVRCRPRLECRMPERVITLAISDADWKALRAVQPEPVDWLKQTIRDAIDQRRRATRPPEAAAARQGRRRRRAAQRSAGTSRPAVARESARRKPHVHKAGARVDRTASYNGRVNVALLGFGTVGQAVARLILASSAPLTLTHICNRQVARKRVDWVPAVGDVDGALRRPARSRRRPDRRGHRRPRPGRPLPSRRASPRGSRWSPPTSS